MLITCPDCGTTVEYVNEGFHAASRTFQAECLLPVAHKFPSDCLAIQEATQRLTGRPITPHRTMDMRQEWIDSLRLWATGNGNVSELWLFGSRAEDRSRPESDIDVALALMPADGAHHWALGNFSALKGKWRQELELLVGRHVSLEAIEPDTEEDASVRRSGTLLWARG